MYNINAHAVIFCCSKFYSISVKNTHSIIAWFSFAFEFKIITRWLLSIKILCLSLQPNLDKYQKD